MTQQNEVRRNAAQQRFELEHEGKISVADYREMPGVLIITHVGVPESQRGQGLAAQVAAGVVRYARQENLKVRPLCSYMAAYFKRHPEETTFWSKSQVPNQNGPNNLFGAVLVMKR